MCQLVVVWGVLWPNHVGIEVEEVVIAEVYKVVAVRLLHVLAFFRHALRS